MSPEDRIEAMTGRPTVRVDAAPVLAVYVLWDDAGDPLYVGQSINSYHRIRVHLADPRKAAIVDLVTITVCDSLAEARRIEADLIRDLQPPLNVAGSTGISVRIVDRRLSELAAERMAS